MKFWNLTATTNADGSKALEILIFGTIEPGFFDDGGVRSAEIAQQLAEHQDATVIAARINSFGGDVFGGIAIYNLLRGHPAAKAGNLTCTVEGMAASAASLIAMAGKTVMQRGSLLMIHNPLTMAFGDANQMRASADVLDKVRDSLVAIYKAKTGKKPGELKALLDAETWLTAEEAKAQGFADEIAEAPVKVKAEGDSVILNSIPFPRASMPAPILAMATEPASQSSTGALLTREAPIVAEVPPAQDVRAALSDAAVTFAAAFDRIATATGRPLLDFAASAAITREMLDALPPVTRYEIAARSSGLIGEILAEGRAAGIAAERARIQAIDELEIAGHAALLAAAKYGETPQTAEQVAVAVIKASKAAGTDMLAARRAESAPATAVRPESPDRTKHADERAAAKQIAEYANRGARS